jgi:hypothetical protein
LIRGEKRREVGGIRSDEAGRFVRVGHERKKASLLSLRPQAMLRDHLISSLMTTPHAAR